MQGVWAVPGEARGGSQQTPLRVMGGGPWSGAGQRGEVPPADPGQAGASRRRIGRIGHGGGVQHRGSAGSTRPRREEGQVQEEKKVAAGSVQQGPQRWPRRPRRWPRKRRRWPRRRRRWPRRPGWWVWRASRGRELLLE